MPGSQGSGPDPVEWWLLVQAPVEHCGDVTGVGEASAGGGGVDQAVGRVLAVEGQ
jgi:hypothetical protein